MFKLGLNIFHYHAEPMCRRHRVFTHSLVPSVRLLKQVVANLKGSTVLSLYVPCTISCLN